MKTKNEPAGVGHLNVTLTGVVIELSNLLHVLGWCKIMLMNMHILCTNAQRHSPHPDFQSALHNCNDVVLPLALRAIITHSRRLSVKCQNLSGTGK